jgi:hypothetical protein
MEGAEFGQMMMTCVNALWRWEATRSRPFYGVRYVAVMTALRLDLQSGVQGS